MDSEKEYVGKRLRIFLSYSSKDKIVAGEIKKTLEEFDLEVFVAHDDISPSEEWEKTILQNLDSTDIFLPLISTSFKLSPWVDQETGIAIAKEKFIIPISVDETKQYGFLAKYQSLKFDEKNISGSCWEIIKCIKNNPRFANALLDAILKKFSDSSSFDQAGYMSGILLDFKEFSDQQIAWLIKSISENGQILYSHSARQHLVKILKKFKKQIGKGKLTKINKRLKNNGENFKFSLR